MTRGSAGRQLEHTCQGCQGWHRPRSGHCQGDRRRAHVGGIDPRSGLDVSHSFPCGQQPQSVPHEPRILVVEDQLKRGGDQMQTERFRSHGSSFSPGADCCRLPQLRP